MPTFDTWLLLIIALINAPTWVIAGITLWYARRTEKNTNSMKDALVAAVAKGEHADGVMQGRAEEKADAKT